MNKLTTSILLAGVMAATMIGAVHAGPSLPSTPTAVASQTVGVTGYRFATVIKTQASRDQQFGGSSIPDAQANLNIIYSPSFVDMPTCEKASKVMSELMGSNVVIKVATASASETHQNSPCMGNNGP